ncbi:MAG: NADP-dependent isocitrate dehydrogenase [Planctomycetota bacterium]
MTQQKRITVARGDGIGPEITEATLDILKAAGVPIAYDEIEVGEAVYLAGNASGIPDEAWDVIRRNKVLLKGPITTPQGGGYKSLNVTIRKSLGLFANVRECKAYCPYIGCHFPEMNLVIVRENEEDLYAGIEHRQTQEVIQSLKLVTRPGSEKIVRYAFEYARANGRKKVTCMTKDNIMKATDGMFHRVFEEIGAEYPDIEKTHQIIDIGAANLAAKPDTFDVIVTLNLYGDVLSDIAAQVAGSVGLAGSANVGTEVAMFEAIHGSAPDIAGKGIANPSGMLIGAMQMLVHIGLAEYAERITNAWLRTLEDGIHTGDIYRADFSKERVDTKGFTKAVIERLGQEPSKLRPVRYGSGSEIKIQLKKRPIEKKELVGVDVFIDWDQDGRDPQVIGSRLREADAGGLKLKMITNRGVQVYPEGQPETFKTDHWRCRFVSADGKTRDNGDVIALLQSVGAAGFDVIKTENLYTFDGQRGYSLGQGEH